MCFLTVASILLASYCLYQGYWLIALIAMGGPFPKWGVIPLLVAAVMLYMKGEMLAAAIPVGLVIINILGVMRDKFKPVG